MIIAPTPLNFALGARCDERKEQKKKLEKKNQGLDLKIKRIDDHHQ